LFGTTRIALSRDVDLDISHPRVAGDHSASYGIKDSALYCGIAGIAGITGLAEGGTGGVNDLRHQLAECDPECRTAARNRCSSRLKRLKSQDRPLLCIAL